MLDDGKRRDSPGERTEHSVCDLAIEVRQSARELHDSDYIVGYEKKSSSSCMARW